MSNPTSASHTPRQAAQAPGSPAMDLEPTLDALGLTATRAQWQPEWDESGRAGLTLLDPFLTEAHVRASCAWIGMAPEIVAELVPGLDLFTAHPAARRLALHVYHTIFLSTTPLSERRQRVIQWPELPEDIHPRALMFYALVMLAGLPRLREIQARRGIPETVTRDTLADLELWLRKHRQRAGAWGFTEKRWLTWHFMGQLAALGRLQFTLESFPWSLKAYRHRQTRQVLLLAGDGALFRADGQYANAAGPADPAPWTSRFEESGGVIRGHLIAPDGRALPRQVSLPAADWACVLQKGDPILGVHIPETGPMDMARCRESLERAMAFFPRHFPEHPFRAFTCHSWLCTSEFESLLPESSNIHQFARQWYLYPLPDAGPNPMFIQLFGHTFANWDDVPLTSSLLRAVVARLKAGGHVNNGAGFILPEDLDWGRAVYRR